MFANNDNDGERNKSIEIEWKTFYKDYIAFIEENYWKNT